MATTALFLILLSAIIQPQLVREIFGLGLQLAGRLLRLALILLALFLIALWMKAQLL